MGQSKNNNKQKHWPYNSKGTPGGTKIVASKSQKEGDLRVKLS